MISMLVYNSNKTELQEIERQIHDLAACLTEEKWDISCFSDLDETEAFCSDNFPL